MDEQTGTSARGGSVAMPIVIGLLSLLLVTETIGLGYFAMQTVTQQSTQVEMLATNPAIVENVLETGSAEHPILSHVVFGGETRIISPESEEKTDLRDRYLNEIADTSCEPVYKHVDKALRNNYGVLAENVSDASVRELFSDNMTTVRLSQLGNMLDQFDHVLYQVCPSDAGDYVVLLDAASGSIATVATYTGEGKAGHWLFYQPVRGVMDGAVWFIPEFFPDGSPLLTTGYGDAGYLWWNFWLPTPEGATYLLESCTEGPHFVDVKGSEYPVEAEGREIACEVEYVE